MTWSSIANTVDSDSECKYCHATTTTCHKFPLTCPMANNCDIGTVCHSDMDEHRKICPLETIDCEYNKVGCGAKMLCKDLEKHSEDT